jgi:uncharacterized protein (TIGR01777 family)
VHLAGETVAGRWTDSKKARIRGSRLTGPRVLSQALAALDSPPEVLVCASAVGFYGKRGDESIDERDPGGSGFLADVVREWEAAAWPAVDAGIRVVNLRFGVVLSPGGGALKAMLPVFRLGLGGRLGSGRQYLSWVALDDVVGAILHALSVAGLSGPVNTTAPNPATNAEFSRTLGRVLGRPAIVPAPAFAIRLALGEFSGEVLGGARVLPAKLLESGYAFRFPQLEDALRHVLGRTT